MIEAVEAIRELLRETAALRLVLVHHLARLPRLEIREIAESVSEIMAEMDAHNLHAERTMMPYRDRVDDILAQALQISYRQKIKTRRPSQLC